MAAKDKESAGIIEPAVPDPRIAGARFVGGAWLAQDGTPLSERESKAAVKYATQRAADAQFTAGVWLAADGSPLSDYETQLAHRAADCIAMEARLRALGGEA